jgi:hypothetical protein
MLSYKTISGKKISDEQILEIKNLFDSSYGMWNAIDSLILLSNLKSEDECV